MWSMQPTDDYERCLKWYVKKRPRELEGAVANLNTFFQCLCAGSRPQDAKFGFVHPEPVGILAFDQGSGSLQETRLYVYPHEKEKTLHLLRIGDKQSQQSDIAQCKICVTSIKKREPTNDKEKELQQRVGNDPRPSG